MMMIQIEESKVEKMSELAEKMLKYGGKLMSCIEELSEESGMGMRGGQGGGSYGSRYGNRMGERYGERGGYGNRGGMNYRDEEEWEEYEEMMGERRGVRGSGRGRR